MKKILILITPLLLLLNGCLVFNTVSYEVKPDSFGGGVVTITVNDIRSDAIDSAELETDKLNLFEFILESEEFKSTLAEEGKFVKSRELYLEDGKLMGKGVYAFDQIVNVEGIVYEEPYYYLTIALEDSIVSTNGEVIESDGYKRIIWDDEMETLQFTMFSQATEEGSLTSLADDFKEEE